jgi:hypothetical protein
MKPILKLLTAPLLLLCGLAHAQVKTNFSNPDSSFNKTIKNIIEFSFFETYNKQGEYSSQFGNVSYSNNLKLYGTDIGFKVDYKRMIYDKMFAKIGLGIMRFAVNKIDNATPSTKSNARPIDYPSNVFILYSTTKYHYNNIFYHLGLEKQFNLAPNLFLFAGADYFHAFTFSQKYYIPAAGAYYKTSRRGDYGDFFNLDFGIIKKWKEMSIAPGLILPIFKKWKQNIAFKEDPTKSVSNWGGGIGISLNASFY